MRGFLKLFCTRLVIQDHVTMGLAFMSKRFFARNHSYKNVFPQQVHFYANHTYLHMKGFVLHVGLVLKQTYKVTRKWPIQQNWFEIVSSIQLQPSLT